MNNKKIKIVRKIKILETLLVYNIQNFGDDWVLCNKQDHRWMEQELDIKTLKIKKLQDKGFVKLLPISNQDTYTITGLGWQKLERRKMFKVSILPTIISIIALLVSIFK